MAESQRYVHIQTFGCQMNIYDTERMLQVLGKDGYASTDDPARADLILLNTCSVREKAEHKMLSALGRYHRLKEFNDELILGVTGCVATQERDRLFKKVPYLDLVAGPDNIAALPEMVRTARASSERAIETRFFNKREYDWIPLEPQNRGRVSAMLTIMKGCNKFCSFCVVPFTRGREVSKPADLIVEEVRRLVASGVPEVMLLGQNVNSYGNDRPGEPDFAELLALVNGVPGLERIRFTTSHPWDCTDALVESFSGHLNTLCEYFHLPVQSGSNSMLEKMRRGYTIESYLERIDALRAACPEIAMSTDIIVGFPGETEEQHAATIELLKTVRYESIFAFTYSERPGTAAARLVDDVPLPVKKARLKEVLELQNAITHARLQERFDGTTVEVLVEGLSSKASRPEVDAMFSSQLTGRTRTNVVVNFDRGGDTSFKVGDVVEVAIDEVNSHSLHGRVVRTVRSARAA